MEKNLIKITNRIGLLCISFLIFSSCQNEIELEEITFSKKQINLRDDEECDLCPNVLGFSDFEFFEASNSAFVSINPSDYNWECFRGSPDIVGPTWSPSATEFNGYTFDNNLAFLCTGAGNGHNEGILYRGVDIKPGIDYCLSFDAARTGFANSTDAELTLHVNFDDGIGAQCNQFFEPVLPCDISSNACVEVDIESQYEYPNLNRYNINLNFSESHSDLYLYALTQQITNSSWDGMFLDNIILSCKSSQLEGIGSEKNGCSYTFWADERPGSDIDIMQYAWDFGDGTTGQGDDITHTYTESGDYAVTLYIVDENGCCHTEEIEVNCEMIDADYCKYICHEDYIGHIKCANGFVYKDNITGLPTPIPFSGSYLQTDFEEIAEEIQSYFNSIGADMIVTPTHPTGEILCYKSICIGCPYTGDDGVVIIPTWSDDIFVTDADGVPTGELVPNLTQVIGTITSDPQWNGAEWVVIEATITIIINVIIDPSTIVVTPNPGGGYLIEYGYTDGIFAIGDHELLTVTGSDTWNGSNCTGSNANNTPVPFFDSCN